MELKITKEPELSEMDACSMVSKALRNGIYGAEEEFDKLPEVVQQAVGSPSMIRNWAQMECDAVESVIQSNFMRSFRAKKKAQREMAALPADVKETFEQISGAFDMKQIAG